MSDIFAETFALDVRKAVRSALNKTARKGLTDSGRAVRQRYAFKQRDLRAAIRLERAKNRNLEAVVTISGRKLPLHLFSPRKRKNRSITVKIRKDRPRRIVKGGFAAPLRLRSRRFLSIGKRKDKPRLPIRLLLSISAAEAYDQAGEEAYIQSITENLPRILNSELNFFLNK